jgi:hypothetical protein
MWSFVQISVGSSTHKARYRLEAGKLVMEWSGGRITEWCGMLRPEVVATSRLRQLVSRSAMAA